MIFQYYNTGVKPLEEFRTKDIKYVKYVIPILAFPCTAALLKFTNSKYVFKSHQITKLSKFAKFPITTKVLEFPTLDKNASNASFLWTLFLVFPPEGKIPQAKLSWCYCQSLSAAHASQQPVAVFSAKLLLLPKLLLNCSTKTPNFFWVF